MSLPSERWSSLGGRLNTYSQRDGCEGEWDVLDDGGRYVTVLVREKLFRPSAVRTVALAEHCDAVVRDHVL